MKVKVADVARAARKYLDPQREVTAVVKPPAESPGVARAAARAVRGGAPFRAADGPAVAPGKTGGNAEPDWK